MRRLRGMLESRFAEQKETCEIEQKENCEWEAFMIRLEERFPHLLDQLLELYGSNFDFYYHLERLVEIMGAAFLQRSPQLKISDAMREADPHWFQRGHLIGAMAYVDLFANDLVDLRKHIPYLQELGITYLHLMPVYKTPDGDDDGGYAVSSYRELDPTLGTIDELKTLADELREKGISLVLDFIFNHTSDEHEWAQRAKASSEDYQDYYFMFDSRREPDEYEKHLRTIFPEEHPGSFTYINRLKKWVWTTFHTYQWDLNYRNPEVFNAMVAEMLHLANLGVDVLRLDAVPFCWKEKGTGCENLPEAHLVIRAFNSVASVVAPGVVFKSEAIVAPDEISKYISPEECQVSYNPLLMALLWESLATRDVKLLKHSMKKRFHIDAGCAWINYVRSHDDIGWGFDNLDAEELGMNPHDHRNFLNQFFFGRHEASFAEGEPFQEDAVTGDARVSGTCASLCGLGRALKSGDEAEVRKAIDRILLIHGVIFTIGGIPLIYLGDEIGMLNDHSYQKDLEKEGDSRWLHRPKFDWEKAELRNVEGTPEYDIYHGLLRFVRLRGSNPAIASGDTDMVETGNPHVFGYFRTNSEQSVLCLANFSESVQVVEGRRLRQLGLKKALVDLVNGRSVIASHTLELAPYQFAALLG
ncbi:amylosucrase [Sulfuriroseicoccus oceanibius]|uniref:Glycosyl hydrolase family 13 catalytic domain-containing protein n=1 Tax=Sulfuriroseicoccus oceanibius TaxID=2707525 RepID=A0A6B3L4P0_9BACT|nr:amylosucrase [Sulfuriroseicoccus oceanibius]QQL45987.1 hypothetical protein G3M56_005255 [Sulfuriroseicoccus oceanibius]